jgi:hypothetical protein
MGGIPSSSGGGGSAASSATSGVNLGSDVYNYGIPTPAAPPGQSPSWLMPAIIGGVALVAVFLFTRK